MPKDDLENYKRTIEKGIVETMREPLIVLDADLRVISANKSFYRTFKVNHKETVGRLIYDLGNRQWNIPKLRKLLEEILPKSTTIENYEVEHDFKTIGPKTMLLNARRLESTQMILLAIEDITERKKVEQIAKEAREYVEAIVDTVREPLIVLDADLRVISANKSFYRSFKVNPKETQGRLIYDLGNRQWNIPKLKELLKNILPQKIQIRGFEITHNFENIGLKTMLLNARELTFGDDKTKGVLLAIEDITKRRITEGLLSASEARYHRLYESSKDGILIIDAKTGMIIDVNPFFIQLLGFSHKQFLAKKIWDIGLFKDIAANKAQFLKLQKKKYVRYESLPLKTAKGEQINVEFVSTVYNVDNQKVIQCHIRDITERKRTEEALRRSEAHLKEAQSLGRIGSWEFDVEKQTIVWSEETYVLYERDPKLGPPSPEEEARYYSAEQAKTLRDYAARAIETGKKFSYDLTAKLPSGRTVYLAATMRPVKDERGRVVKLFGTVQDITNRKIKEEELIKRTEESERFSKLSVGRELKMVELKKRISELENQIKDKSK